MFDIGMLEMLIVATVALLILGPERMPRVLYKTGKWLGHAKRVIGKWSSELDRQLENDALARESGSNSSQTTFGKDIDQLNQSIRSALSGKDLDAIGKPGSSATAGQTASATKPTTASTEA